MKQLFVLGTVFGALLAASFAVARGSADSQAMHSSLHVSGRQIWVRTLASNADSAPAFLPRSRFPGHRRAAIYVLAGNNGSNCSEGDPVRRAVLYALDANTGSQLWSKSTRGPTRCTTAGPAVDPSGRWVYAPGFDGRVHRYQSATGKEDRTRGWPQLVTRMPDVEKVAATLTVTKKYLYVTTSGFIGDQGHYQGHLVTINLATGRSHVFNSLCSNIHALLWPDSSHSPYCSADKSGLFGRGQGVVDPVNGDVYIVSGNGPWNGKTNWGDSIMKLNPSGQRLLDTFTPTNQADLEAQDADLGSTGPALLPAIREGSRTYHLLVQGGKGPACGSCRGTALRLLNRDDLSGKGRPGHLGGDLQDVQAPGGCEVLTAPAVWTNTSTGEIWVFYANGCGVAGYRLSQPSPGTFHLDRMWSVKDGGTTPVVGHGALFVAHDGAITAYAPSTGAVLWRGSVGSIHWQYPRIVNGRLFIADNDGHIRAFALQ